MNERDMLRLLFIWDARVNIILFANELYDPIIIFNNFTDTNNRI